MKGFNLLGVAAWLVMCCGVTRADPTPLPGDRDVAFGVSDKITYDDNIFRLPAAGSPGVTFPGPGFSDKDELNTAGLGMDGVWTFGLQSLLAKLGVADNRFIKNTALDNVSAAGKLEWDWVFTELLSGKLGGDYSRALADFANTQFYAKDIVSSGDLYANAVWDLGPHWRLKANFRGEEATHSAQLREGDDYESRAGGIGAEYALSPTNALGLDYQFTDTSLRQGQTTASGLIYRDYTDDALSAYLKYSLTAVTVLEVGGGYVKRTYTPDGGIAPPGSGDFTGDIWHVALTWTPTALTSVKVKAWRDLNAYIDAESNYFVSRGVSIAPVWSPLERLSIQPQFAREYQNFIGAGADLAAGSLPLRRDVLTSASLGAQYKFRRRIEIDAAYKYERRSSDIDFVQYRDNLVNFSIKYTF